jgi:hypothetical protein
LADENSIVGGSSQSPIEDGKGAKEFVMGKIGSSFLKNLASQALSTGIKMAMGAMTGGPAGAATQGASALTGGNNPIMTAFQQFQKNRNMDIFQA